MAISEIFEASNIPSEDVCLDTIIDMSETQGPCPTEQFIMSGLRAARGANPNLRRTILMDLAHVLGCSVDELGFMFCEPVFAANDSDPVVMPDYRRMLHEDMYAVAR